MRSDRLFLIVVVVGIYACCNTVTPEGFYKTIFMDAGVGLVAMTSLPAADKLSYSLEYISVDSLGTDTQNLVMVKNPQDDNGVLLYPDGQPRFALLYTCGGYGDHIGSLGVEGVQRIKDFYYHGGSFVGTCMGNYLASRWGYGIYPGTVVYVALKDQVGGIIPHNSPLLRYYDFGGDFFIDSIMHADGGYGRVPMPNKTELMLTHRHASEMDSQPSCWAYKEHDTTGRIVGLTSHPEYEWQGEKLHYFMACLQYSIAGLSRPSIKGTLANGRERVMNRTTGEGLPAHTKIGDLQYHHFKVFLTGKTSTLYIELDGETGYDFHLFANRDTCAFKSTASYSDILPGARKILLIPSADAGTWYIGVKCATTVTATKKCWGFEYSGNLSVLNGAMYTIKARWDESSVTEQSRPLPKHPLIVKKTDCSLCVSIHPDNASLVSIFDTHGRLYFSSGIRLSHQLNWQFPSHGIYLIRFQSKKMVTTQKIVIVR
ncbi:MAG: T9SS type A sorting domain-containing protein [Chitinivibrionales bacterium]|nr:T9SS type A sorting domain-containing protein [Chitinivibrionales bacterium]